MKNIKEKGTILPAVIFFLVLFIFIAGGVTLLSTKGIDEGLNIRESQNEDEKAKGYITAIQNDMVSGNVSDIWFQGNVVKGSKVESYIFVNNRAVNFVFDVPSGVSGNAYITIINEGASIWTLDSLQSSFGNITVSRDNIHNINSKVDSFMTQNPLAEGRYIIRARILTTVRNNQQYALIVRIFHN